LYCLRTVKERLRVRLRAWIPENSHAAAPSRDAPHPPTDRGFCSTGRWRGVPPTKSVFVVLVYAVTGCSRRNNNNIIHARCRRVVVPDTTTPVRYRNRLECYVAVVAAVAAAAVVLSIGISERFSFSSCVRFPCIILTVFSFVRGCAKLRFLVE